MYWRARTGGRWQLFTFTFTFICHPGKTHNLRQLFRLTKSYSPL